MPSGRIWRAVGPCVLDNSTDRCFPHQEAAYSSLTDRKCSPSSNPSISHHHLSGRREGQPSLASNTLTTSASGFIIKAAIKSPLEYPPPPPHNIGVNKEVPPKISTQSIPRIAFPFFAYSSPSSQSRDWSKVLFWKLSEFHIQPGPMAKTSYERPRPFIDVCAVRWSQPATPFLWLRHRGHGRYLRILELK